MNSGYYVVRHYISGRPRRSVRRASTLSISCSCCEDSLVNQPFGRAPIPSSVYTVAAVWLVVFSLVLHEVGFAWSTGMIAATALCLLFLASFLMVRSTHARRSSREDDHRSW